MSKHVTVRPNALKPNDPGYRGEGHSLRDRLSDAAFANAMRRAGHDPIASVDASAKACADLLALVAEHKRQRGR